MAEIKKYLDLTGLETFKEGMDTSIDQKDATTLQSAKSYADSLADNYDPAGQATTLVQALENGQVATNKNDIATLKTGKADKATTLAGYGIGDAYTKEETDAAIGTAVANADHLKREIVESLPDAESVDEHTIYMVGTGTGSQDSVYEEYMFINGEFEKIGSSEVSLEGYATESYVNTAKAEAISTAETNTDSKITEKVGEIGGTVKDYVDTAKSEALSAAQGYADSLAGNYATVAQGTKADTALQQADITTGSANGTISVKGFDMPIKGLASAAYVETSAFDAAGTASGLVTALEEGQVATNTSEIATIKGQIADLQAGTVTAITEEDILALFE